MRTSILRRMMWVFILTGSLVTLSVAHAAAPCTCVQYAQNRLGIDLPYYAKDAGPALQRNGLNQVANPQVGAVAVMQPTFPGANATSGHIGIIIAITNNTSTWNITLRQAGLSRSTGDTEYNCSNVNSVSFSPYNKTRTDISYWVTNSDSSDNELTQDITGDDRADVVAVRADDERFVYWSSKDTSMGFNSGAEGYNGPFNYSNYEFRLADVDSDQKADVVGIDKNDERFVVWLSTGAGFSGGHEWYNGVNGYGAYEFRVADVSGDHKADVVGIDKNDERFVVWLSDGTRFGGGYEWYNGVNGYGRYEFRIADVNADQKADVVGIRRDDERFVVWLSDGTRFAGGNEWYNGPYDYSPYDFRVADVNGDQSADIVGIRRNDERFVVWLSDGTRFAGGNEWYNGPYDYSPYDFRVADVNGDQRADIVGIRRDDERFVVWLSDGTRFAGGNEWCNGPYNYSSYRY